MRVVLLSIFLIPTAQGVPVEEAPAVRVVGRRPVVASPAELTELGGESAPVTPGEADDAAKALRRFPAVTVRRTGGEGAEPLFLIRGQDPVQNRYFLEGVPLTEGEFNAALVSALPLGAVDRVDLFASGVPVALATDGLGGAVDFRLPREPRPSALQARGGAYGLAELSAVTGGVAFRGVRSDENFTYFDDNGTSLDDSDDGIRVREHNRFRRVSLLPTVSLGSSTRLFGLGSYARTQVPGPTSLPARAELTQGLALAGLAAESGPLGLRAWLRGAWDRLEDPERTLSLNYPLNRAANHGAGVRGKWTLAVSPFRRLEAVGALAWDGFTVSQSGGAAATHGRWASHLGTTADLVSGDWTVSPGLLGGFYHYPAGGGDFARLSPRVGWRWRPAGSWQWRGAVGRYFRAPAMGEIYGSPSGVSPAPGLRPEGAWKAETGVDVRFRRWRGSYTFGFSRARDLVTFLPNTQWTRVAVNVGESRILSHELSLEAEATAGLVLSSAVALLAGTNLSAVSYWRDRRLPGLPPYRWDAGARYGRGKWWVAYRYSLWGPTYEDLANLKRRSALSDHGVEAAWSPSGWGTWRLEILNLADVIRTTARVGAFQTAENNTGLLGHPAPGRRFYLSWRYEL